MATVLFLCGALGALLIPGRSELISVCYEEDEDLRVDCRIEPKSNKINSFQFSWSSGTKQSVINTNVSGAAAEAQFRDKSEVVELDPHGYRMTLKDFKNTLPHNTTYICDVSGQIESIIVEKEKLEPCSAVSLFLKNSWSWIAPLLIFLYYTHC